MRALASIVVSCALGALHAGHCLAQRVSDSEGSPPVTWEAIQSCRYWVATETGLSRQEKQRMATSCLPANKDLLRFERETCTSKAGKPDAETGRTCKWLKNHLAATAKKFRHSGGMRHASGGPPMEHMFGYVELALQEDGSGTVAVKFSNGARLVGGSFRAIVELQGADGTALRTLKFKKNIGMAGFHGAVERGGVLRVALSEAELQQFQRLHASYCIDGIGDVNDSSGLSVAEKAKKCPGWPDPAREQ